MLQDLFSSVFKVLLGVFVIGLAIAIFLIGIVALWYFMLIGMVVWFVRSLYLAWKPKPVVEVIVQDEQRPSSKQARPGRVIDHE